MMNSYICDTNYVLRYLLEDNPEQFIEAKRIFDQAKTGQVTIILEQTVFTEIIFVLSSYYKVPKEKIVSTLGDLIAYKGLHAEKELLLTALEFYAKDNLHIVDSLLAARNKLTKKSLLSFDQKLIKVCE